MRAVTVTDRGLVWHEHPDPVPGTGELLVRVRAAGINGADMLQRDGLYAAPPDAPADIPGLELAGEVAATGPGVTRFGVGDRVMALVGGGAQSELALVHERVAMAVPDGIDWPEAGGFSEVFTTAHDALFTQCGLQLGERVLVHGAAGGVGTAGVQLAARAGARVVATVRNEALRAQVAELMGEAGGGGPGPRTMKVVAHDEVWHDLGPYDVVLELIGAVNVPGDLAALASGGRISVIGVGAGARVELDLLALMGKRARIHGSTLRARPLEQKADAARRVEHTVVPLLASGAVRVPVAATFPMAEAEAAYDNFVAGGKLGKLVLIP